MTNPTASPIEAIYERNKHLDALLSDSAWCEGPRLAVAHDLWEAIKAELALREKAGAYTENSVDFPTPGHIFPFETKHPDPPHLIASECPCKPQRDAEGYWVHRKRNFTRSA